MTFFLFDEKFEIKWSYIRSKQTILYICFHIYSLKMIWEKGKTDRKCGFVIFHFSQSLITTISVPRRENRWKSAHIRSHVCTVQNDVSDSLLSPLLSTGGCVHIQCTAVTRQVNVDFPLVDSLSVRDFPVRYCEFFSRSYVLIYMHIWHKGH